MTLLRRVTGQLSRAFDPREGGFGTQPKFPHPTELRLLLRVARRFDDGQVCGSRDALEFDHFRPFAKGGRSDDARNVRLLCRMHNRMAARSEGMFSGAKAAS